MPELTQEEIKAKLADFDLWPVRDKVILKVLLDLFNRVQSLHGLPEKTGEEFKAYLATKM